jgi:hypothetical protein
VLLDSALHNLILQNILSWVDISKIEPDLAVVAYRTRDQST